NSADVTAETDVAAVDMAEVRRWYAERGVPWGVRVPQGMAWPYGRRLLTKRAMALATADLREPADPAGVQVRPADPADLADYARVDAAAFYKLTRGVEAQVNVENVFGADYFPTAHNDNNIAPGAPRTVKATLRFGL
ncbi:MAG TPA: hypothetical protein VFS45_05745, partial [Sphingomicrobium sp.]|nr:hypothetical protein [Sphingomicrobium sp.]